MELRAEIQFMLFVISRWGDFRSNGMVGWLSEVQLLLVSTEGDFGSKRG